MHHVLDLLLVRSLAVMRQSGRSKRAMQIRVHIIIFFYHFDTLKLETHWANESIYWFALSFLR